MRVLTLTNGYPPHAYGGYELTCDDVMRRFREHGHEATVLTVEQRLAGVAETDEPHVRRKLELYWDWDRNRPAIPRSPRARLRIEQHNLTVLDEALRATRPDVVSVWHMGALSLSLLSDLDARGIPMVFTVANEWPAHCQVLDGWARLWRRWPVRPRSIAGVPTRPPRLSHATFNVVSEFTRQRTMSRGAPWDLSGATIVSPGIDTDDFPLSAAKPREKWSWNVLYVGRIDPPKGVETLIRGFALLPPTARLEIVGGGDAGYQQKLLDQAHELGIADRLTIHSLPRDQVRDRYVASDVVVFPSEWEEPFGLVPLEAMACARPVVATARGGSVTFLRDRDNCVVFGVSDPRALADAVIEVAKDDDLRRHVVAGGLATVPQYTAERYATELMRLHEAAAANAPRQGAGG
jgi:glycogen synthase